MDYSNSGQALGSIPGNLRDMPQRTAQSSTPFELAVQISEGILKSSAEAEARLNSMLARIIGPVPTPVQNENKPASQFGGHLGALDVRLTQAAAVLQRVHEMLTRIEQVI